MCKFRIACFFFSLINILYIPFSLCPVYRSCMKIHILEHHFSGLINHSFPSFTFLIKPFIPRKMPYILEPLLMLGEGWMSRLLIPSG